MSTQVYPRPAAKPAIPEKGANPRVAVVYRDGAEESAPISKLTRLRVNAMEWERFYCNGWFATPKR